MAIELKALGLLKPSLLWDRLTPGWTLAPLLTELNAKRPGQHLPEFTLSELGDAVAYFAERDAQRFRMPPTRVVGRVLLLLMIAGLLVVAWRRGAVPSARRAQVAVAMEQGLPPFHVITARDVRLTDTALDAQAFVKPGDVEGRVTLRAYKAREVLRRDQLAPAGALTDLDARVILTVPVRDTDSSLGATLPATVTLLLSERPYPNPAPVAGATAAAGSRVDSVYLLALTRAAPAAPAVGGSAAGSTTATIAITPRMLEQIHPLLARSDVTLAWPAPRR